MVSEVWVRGPLATYADGFAEFLASQGYTAGSVRLQMHLVAQLSRWMEVERLDVGELSGVEAERFMAARRARVRRLFRSCRALEPVLGYLRGVGVVPVAMLAAPVTAVDEFLGRFRRYLLVERTVTAGSAKVYVSAVRGFVASFERDGRLELRRMMAADVSAFVLAETARRGTSICSVTTALRSLLVFLHVEGEIERSLTFAVPGVGAWRVLARGAVRRCPGRWSQVISAGCLGAAIDGRRLVVATSRSLPCWAGWGCGVGRSLR